MKVALLVLSLVVPAVDNGQFKDVDPSTRQWFESVRSQHGVPCCSVADGHLTDYVIKPDGYWVPIDGEMRHVPPEAVVRGAGNPFDVGVVWYVIQNGSTYFIRCFVPNSDV